MWMLALSHAAEDPTEVVHALQEPVSQVRELSFTEEVRISVLTPEEAGTELKARIADAIPEERLRVEGLTLRAFGLVGPGFDFFAALMESLEQHIGGFWEPFEQTLVLVPREDVHFELEAVVRHELVHALQDQHFDIRIKTDATLRNDDLLLAFECLMEGDAAYTELLAVDPDMDTRDLRPLIPGVWPNSPVLGRSGPLPVSELEAMMAPYTLGAEFVQGLRRQGGWEAVNAAFASPPLSTEMILHPAKRTGPDRDLPTRIHLEVGRAAGRGFTAVYDNSLGELNLALIFRQLGRPLEAWDIAAGWDGDRFVLLENVDQHVVLVWRSEWDTPEDAREFAEAAGTWLHGFDPRAVIDVAGTGVVAVVGAPDGRSARLVKRAWRARLTAAGSVSELLGFEPAEVPATEARPPSTAP